MLVPSRLRQGEFYALPQSPQLFKQLLMIAGVERYFQIARCYRDEDFRADRQVEFTQLDLEGSFWEAEDVQAAIEVALVAATKELRDVEIPTPFPRLTWREAMERFGTDKPDTRFGMEIVDLSDLFGSTEFGVFASTLEHGGTIRGINAGERELSRAEADGLVERAKQLGGKGLVWMQVEADGNLRSPVAKFFTESEKSSLVTRLGARPGDVLLIAADRWRTARGASAASATSSGVRKATTSWPTLGDRLPDVRRGRGRHADIQSPSVHHAALGRGDAPITADGTGSCLRRGPQRCGARLGVDQDPRSGDPAAGVRCPRNRP